MQLLTMPPRRLTAGERALWARVAATVRALPGKSAAVDPPPPIPGVAVAPPPPGKQPRRLPRSTAALVPVPAPAPARKPMPVAAATLDGSWDTQLRRGNIHPDRSIDLHGHDLAAAHGALNGALDAAIGNGDRVLLIITGKGRPGAPGRIKAQLADWLDLSGQRHRIAALRPAHVRHGGGGAFYLVLRRPRA